jgi:disulfide bond formation protein DsbB
MSRALLLGPLAAALALAIAYASQHWGGLPPCPLCIWQRWPYWAAIGLGLAALALPARLRPGVLAAMAVLFLGNAAIAALHAGVEWGFWPSPVPECLVEAGAPAGSVDDLLRTLRPLPAIPCDEAAIRVLGLSMAGWNAVYALVVGGVLASWARRCWRSGRDARAPARPGEGAAASRTRRVSRDAAARRDYPRADRPGSPDRGS